MVEGMSFTYSLSFSADTAEVLSTDGKLSCRECGRRVLQSSMSNHMRLHSSQRFTCMLCKKQFVHKCSYQGHMYRIHNVVT